MKKMILFFAVGFLLSCNNNPYEGLGPLQTDAEKKAKQDAPKPRYAFVGSLSVKGEEGQELIEKFEIKDEANPQGPFGIYLRNFPEGTQLIQISASQFEVRYLPPATFVKGQTSRLSQSEIHVVNPDGRYLEKAIVWEINNKPVLPSLLVPTGVTVTAGDSLQLSLLGQDFNGESLPDVTILSPQLDGLTIQRKALNGEVPLALPTAEYVLKWAKVPTSMAGQVVSIQLNVCDSIYGVCQVQVVDVTVVVPVP